ncbi:YadA-like family protein [Burkholderia cenocepacia]|uniref:YadA-like family protein n=1 Tax=Burkholderia cenocepacia TaxID=95486 RepID=UPI0022386D8A|nr:YadA-like family protein [Burkholderia cenocepacia]MCW5115758.1 YadA-like family protein [Burkholderia cenocepacia]MCW5131958.1 YadA-like family protein [Burkholderia cenocepacia]MCW5176068.1 YadA-like family protein [Burkholderia cenocepacia]
MNKSYRTVWNATTGTWAAAPETARMRTKSKSNATMKSSVTAAVAVMAGVGGVTMATDANAQAMTGGGLNLCSNTTAANGVRYGQTFGALTNTVNANCAPINTSLPSYQGHAPSFILGNTANTNGATGTAPTASVMGSTDGHLVLYGQNGVHVSGPADFDNNVNMTNHQVKNLAAGTAGTDAVNLNQLNSAIAAAKTTANPYVVTNTGTYAAATAARAGSSATAVGANANAGGVSAVALGGNTVATGQNAVALGTLANATANETVAVGVSAQATGNNATALGRAAVAAGNGSLALGSASRVDTTSSIAVGANARVITGGVTGANSSIAIGNGAVAGGTNSIVIGTNAQHSGSGATVLGSNASAMGGSMGVAVGYNSSAAGASAVSVGTNAMASGRNSIAMGLEASATAINSVVVGYGATGAGETSTAMGTGARATGYHAVSLGANANSAGRDSVALGTNANAANTNSVALGNQSIANRDNSVSVGSSTLQRQITNVAAGTQGTDAVNLNQLNTAIANVSTGANPYVAVRGTTAANATGSRSIAIGDGAFAANSYGAGSGGDTNIAIGANARTTGGFGEMALGEGAAVTGQAVGATAIGRGATAQANQSVALGDGAMADRANTVSVGSAARQRQITNVAAGTQDTDAVNVSQLKGSGLIGDDGKAIAAVTYDRNPDGTPNYGSVTLGNGNGPTQIKNVADATDDHDALNLGQLKDTGLVGDDGTGKLTSLAVTYDDATKGKATLAGVDGTTLSNVKAGAADMDAVNVSQLKGSGLIGDDGKSIAAVTYDRNTDGTPNYGTVTLGHGEGPTQIKNVADATDDHDALNLGQLKDAGLVGDDGAGKLTSAAVTYDRNADGTINHDKATLAGTDGTTLSNVKAGVADMDAVNVSQLKDSGLIGDDGKAIAAVTYDGAAKDKVTLAGTDGTTLSNVKAGAADMDAVNVSQLKGSGLIGDDGKSIAAVTYDRNPDGTPNYGTVTLGNGNGPTQIKNVADATDDHDALNLGQLKDAGLVGDDGAGKLTSLAVTYDDASKDKATLAGTDGTTLSNVKAGVADMDAVNVSQLKDSGLIGDDGKAIAAVTYDGAAKDKVTLAGTDGTTLSNVKAGVADMDAVNVSQLKDSGLIGDDGKAIAAVTYDGAAKDKATLAGTDGTTLSNVKAGVADMDAVNVSQLKDSGLIGDDGKAIAAVTYDGTAKDSVTLGGVGSTTPVALHNVADGVLSATSKDAVNGSQLFATNTRVGDLEDSLSKGGVIDPVTGESLAVVYDGNTKDTVTLAGTDGTTLSNVKAGVADMDAVNVSQLKDSGLIGDDGKSIAAVTYDRNADGTPNMGSVTLGGAGATTPVALKNVATGVDGTDAVNVNQLNTGLSDLRDEMSGGNLRFVKVNADPVTGTPAVASGALAVAIGSDARATSANSLALGSGARVTGTGSVAIGYNSVANQNNVVSVGDVGRERKIVNVADGDVAFQSTDVVNGGQLYAALNNLSTSVTSKTQQAIDTFSSEIDKKTQAAIDEVNSRSMQPMDVSDPLVAIEGLKGNNVASLNGADPTQATAAAIGSSTAASGANAVAVGLQSGAGSNNSVAIGSFAQTGAGQDYSVAVGSNVQTNGTQAVALGANAQANGNYALAVGNNGAQAIGDGSIAVGNAANVRAGSTNAIAIGTGANVARSVEGAMAFGANATAGAANSIALGANAFSDRANALSIGRAGAERQIVNVAAGTQATDAVNVSQLKGVTDSLGGGAAIDAKDGSITKPTYKVDGSDYHNVGDALDALASRTPGDPNAVAYDSAAKDSVTLGGAGATTPVALKNVADAKDDGDALNLGQLKNAGLVGDDGTGNLTSLAVTYDGASKDSVTLGGAGATTPVALHNVADGVLSATSKDAVNGSQLFATNENLGKLKDSLEQGGAIDPTTGESLAVVYDGTAKDTVTLGGAGTTTPVALKNIADAKDDHDALNLGQLKDAGLVGQDGSGNLTSLAVAYDSAAKDTVTLGGAGATAPVALKNVADGTDRHDAINLGQLQDAGLVAPVDPTDPSKGLTSLAVTYDDATKDVATLAGANGTTLSNVKAGVGDMDAVNVSQLKDAGLIDPSTGKSIAAVTYDSAAKDTVTLGGAGATTPVALKNVADAKDDGDALNLGQLKNAGLVGDDGTGNLTSLAVTYDGATKDSVTLGNAGTPVGIHNLAAGAVNATSNDAINGSQLFTVSKSVADKIGGGAGVGADGSITDPTYSVGGQDYHSVGDALGALDKNSGNNPLAVVYDGAAKDAVTLGGAGATTPVALKNVADAKDDGDALNLGQLKNAGLVGDDGTGNLTSAAMTYDKNADGTINHDKATLAGTNGTTLSNVKAGVADMDAVNVSQLKGSGLIGDDGKSIAAVTYDSAAKDTVTLGGAGATTPVALKNVADGTDRHDAINLGQLQDAGLVTPVDPTDPSKGLTSLAVTYDGAAKDTVTLKGTNGTTLSNVKAGVADMDAVNVSQLKDAGLIDPSTGKPIAAVTYDSAAKNSVTLGGAGATTPVALKNVADAKDDGDALNLGQLKNAGLVGDDGTGNLTSAAMTYDKNADGTINHDKATLAGTDGTTLSNVKAGVADMDAVNVSQLKGSGLIGDDGKSIAAVTYDSAAKDTVTLGGAGATTPVALKNVADGTDRHDAINLGQLQDAGLVAPVDPTNPGKGLMSLAVAYDNATQDVVTLKGANGTTITNVKAGAVTATSTDAINGSQLHATAQSVADSLGGGSTVGADGKVTNPTYSLADPTDATKSKDYSNVGDALSNLDGRTSTNTENITVINKQLADSGLVDPVTGQSIAAVTYDRNADGTPNLGSVTLGGAGATAPVALKNVADGVDAHDAVNLGQLQSAGLVAPVDPTNPGAGLTSLAVTYGTHADGSANFDTVTLAGTNGTTITNVKAGAVSATSTDAINGAQLHGVSQSVAKSLGGGATVDADGNVTSPSYKVSDKTFDNVGDAIENISSSLVHGSIGLVQQDDVTRDITVAKDTDGTTVNFAGTAGDRVLTGVGAGAVSATSNDAINGAQLHGTAQSVADAIGGGTIVDADGKLADTSIEVNGNKYKTVAEAVQAAAQYGATDSLAVRYDLNADGTPNYGSVTLGGTGAAPVRLTNVADGASKYDAVNFGQLSELSDRIGGIDDRVGALEQNPGNPNPGPGGPGNDYFAGTDVGTGSTTKANAGDGTGNTAAGSGATVSTGANNATVIGSNANVSQSNGTAIGSGSKSTAEGATSIGSNANASGSKSTAIGEGANASGSNAVALGAGSVATEANTVSFGNGTDDGNRRITNIRDGINETDAATKGQLDRAMGGLQGQVNDLSRNAYSGIAAATALTMIPGVDPGKTVSFGIGGATYKGYQAVAFGGEARITQNLKMKAGVGLSSGGNTVGVGASYQW